MKYFLTTLFILAFWLFNLIHQENRLMELRLLLPRKEKELLALQEEQIRLKVELQTTLSPKNLLETLYSPAYSHLHFSHSETEQ